MENKWLILISCTFFFAGGCTKKQDETELITTVKVTLAATGSAAKTYTWSDPDGPGGSAPLNPDTFRLDSGIIYQYQIEFYNESGGNAVDITPDIKTGSNEHLVCTTVTPALMIFNASDSDGTFPIGLEGSLQIIQTGNCSARFVLRHQPGTKNGSCDPGETDVDVEFPVLIK